VKAGDSLSSIARRTLGDATRWREIADANGLASPDLIRPGQEIMIP
jgi:nucleoid-associated protein YgaU